jgi:hypothetical protein
MDEKKQGSNPVEMIFWSIALPGFGQIFNKDYIKAIVFIFLEFLVNVQGRLNQAIVHSFHGDIELAIQTVDYQWIMFYPCLYVFAMWDAFKSAKERANIDPIPYESIPFSVAAYVTTIGVIFSNKPIFSITFGPIFTPIIAILVGFTIGGFVKKWLTRSFIKEEM